MRKFWKQATRTRKRKIASMAAMAMMLSSTAAFAYYVGYSGASGSASSSIATSGGTTQGQAAVTLSGSFNGASVAPGNAAVPVTIQAVNVSGVSESLQAPLTGVVSVDSSHATAGCQASWFQFTPAANWNGTTVPATDTTPTTVSTTSTIAMPNLAGTNQSACEGATVSIALTSTTTP